MLYLRTQHDKRSSLEHERHIINTKKLNKRVDDIPMIKTDSKTGKLTVTVSGKKYYLKEDV